MIIFGKTVVKGLLLYYNHGAKIPVSSEGVRIPLRIIMAAYERRFPTCPLILMFVGSDTVNEFKSEDGAIHVIERHCKLDVGAPRLDIFIILRETNSVHGRHHPRCCPQEGAEW
uniref:PRELI/MSF1 domain-containing protein n=1 Tax=Theropithecus gelada TaxID=9565 RepID=A0A8D2E6H3_THEGE